MTSLDQTRRRAIHDAFVAGCEPYKLPTPWDHLPCDPSFVQLPHDKEPLLNGLLAQFPAEELQQAGLLAAGAGPAALHPRLTTGGGPLWVIRSAPDAGVICLIANMRTVGLNDWALVAALRDPGITQLLAAPDAPLVVAYSPADLAILRSLGLAAVPGENWSQMGRKEWQFLQQTLRIPAAFPAQGTAQKIPRPEDSPPRELILANWSLATLDPTDVPAAVASGQRLRQIFEELDLLEFPFLLWKPREERLQTLRVRLQYGDRAQIRDTLMASLRYDQVERLRPPRPLAPTFLECYRAWRAAARSFSRREERDQAFQKLCELADQQHFDRLLAEAGQTENRLEQQALLALAEAGRLHFTQTLLTCETLRQRIREQGTQAGGLTKQESAPLLALTNQILALMREIHTCRSSVRRRLVPSRRAPQDKSPQNTIQKRPPNSPPKPPPPNSPRSASAAPNLPR